MNQVYGTVINRPVPNPPWPRLRAANTPTALVNQMNLLLLDVEPDIAEKIQLAIRFRWPEALVSSGGLEYLSRIRRERPDLVVLQGGCNAPSVTRVIQDIRAATDIPLIVLEGSASRPNGELAALDAGADDYVRQSPDYLDLVARMAAVLRRTSARQPAKRHVLECGPLLLDPLTGEASVNGSRLALTNTEMSVLRVFAENEGRVVTHQTLEQRVWDDQADNSALVKKYVQRLRRKLGEAGHRWILSVHGVGYRFVVPDDASSGVIEDGHA